MTSPTIDRGTPRRPGTHGIRRTAAHIGARAGAREALSISARDDLGLRSACSSTMIAGRRSVFRRTASDTIAGDAGSGNTDRSALLDSDARERPSLLDGLWRRSNGAAATRHRRRAQNSSSLTRERGRRVARRSMGGVSGRRADSGPSARAMLVRGGRVVVAADVAQDVSAVHEGTLATTSLPTRRAWTAHKLCEISLRRPARSWRRSACTAGTLWLETAARGQAERCRAPKRDVPDLAAPTANVIGFSRRITSSKRARIRSSGGRGGAIRRRRDNASRRSRGGRRATIRVCARTPVGPLLDAA